MIKGKFTLIQKYSPPKGTAPNSYRPNSVPTYDVENTDSRNQREYLQFVKPRTTPLGNRNDAANGPEEQESYSILMNTSSRREK